MRLDYPIYALLFLIPAYLVRFEVFAIPVNLWEVMFAAVFWAWLAWGFEWRKTIKKSFIRCSSFAILPLGILFLFLGLAFGTVMSPEPRISLGALKGWFVEPILFAVMMRATLARPEQQKKALFALAASGVCVALAALLYRLVGDLTFDGRVSAFYESPNMLAMDIAPALLIVALGLSSKFKVQNAELQLKTQNWRGFLCVGALLLLGTALFLTRSVGAISSLLATFLLWWSWGKFWGKPWGKYGGILFAGILLWVPLVSLFVDPWALAPSSLASRLMIWKNALLVARDHLLFGRGLGTFQYDYLAYQTHFPPYLEWAVPHPHNIFLGTLLAGGTLGLIGMMLVLLHVFKKFQKQFLRQSIVASVAFFIILYLLLHGIIDNTLWRGDMALLWISVLALICAGPPRVA